MTVFRALSAWAISVFLLSSLYLLYRQSRIFYWSYPNHAGAPLTLARLLFASRTPTGRIDGTDEQVTVEGRTETLTEPIETPVSESPALAVRWDVFDIVPDPDSFSRKLWDRRNPTYMREDVEDGRESTPFVIDDGSGPLLVDPSDAQFLFATEMTPGDFPERRRYDEFYLEPDQFAVAAGAVVPTDALDRDFDVPRSDLPDYALTAPAGDRLRLADTDKYGLAYRLPRWNLRLIAALLLITPLIVIMATAMGIIS